MNPVKRLGLAVLLVVGVTLLGSTSARAAAPGDWGTVQLTNVGDEPGATGEASLTRVKRLWSDVQEWMRIDYYSGKLTVKCRNLTPGATYSTPAGTFLADRKGNGGVSGQVMFSVYVDEGWWGPTSVMEPYVVDVVRLDPDGSCTTVLTGEFVPPWATE
ncbi:MAG TPA: hypothetical protein VMY37_18775 [Thermoguttaceae bacterium]|nr:hypothetical protein [Thermoguttaceae bacterium]